jgi:hypothetical protein
LDALVVGGLNRSEHFAEGITANIEDRLDCDIGENGRVYTHRKLRVSFRTCSFKTRRCSRPKPRLSIWMVSVVS